MISLKYFLCLFFFQVTLLALSQSSASLEKANRFYQNYSFHKSIEEYEKVKKKNIRVNRRLAECYLKVRDYKKSEEYWKIVVDSRGHKKEDIYNYVSILKINKKYKDAELWMIKYANLKARDSRGKSWAENSGYFNKINKDEGRFKIKNLDLNTKHEDFGTCYYKNKIVFASTRKNISFFTRKWNWNKLPYLDIYSASIKSDLQLDSIEKFDKKLDKRFHEGPATFNAKGDYMIFTRNNYKRKRRKKKVFNLQLYSSVLKNGEWQEPEPLPFNSNSFSVGHATLSSSGDTLFFASDKRGGYGGVDLYISIKNKSGGWSRPENLGGKINTEGNEMFPFIHPGGLLFFASDGLLGLGGLDVFVSQMWSFGYSKPINLGVPINSNYDDFAFILNKERKTGYFSSNRIEGQGDDDIYLHNMLKPLPLPKLIRGKVMDKDSNLLVNAKVTLVNKTGELLENVYTKRNGLFEFEAERNKSFLILANKIAYKNDSAMVDTKSDKKIIYQDLFLEGEKKFSLYCFVSDKKTEQPLKGVRIILFNLNNNKVDTVFTSNSGDYYSQLLNMKTNDTLNYEIELYKPGYLTEKHRWTKILTKEGQYDISEDLDLNVKNIKIGSNLEELIDMKPIYFDYNKSNIRDAAASELDKIVKIMNENPNLKIEIRSHTDCRGDDSFNQKLSNNRAKSTIRYIQNKITSPSRIFGKGYGENFLKIDCGCDSSQEDGCTEEEHQMNRRTEFIIVEI